MSETGEWRLSPAYDLTYAAGPGGEHWTSYNGEGRNPGSAHLLALAKTAAIGAKRARAIIGQVASAVATFAELAKEHDIPLKVRAPIARHLDAYVRSVGIAPVSVE